MCTLQRALLSFLPHPEPQAGLIWGKKGEFDLPVSHPCHVLSVPPPAQLGWPSGGWAWWPWPRGCVGPGCVCRAHRAFAAGDGGAGAPSSAEQRPRESQRRGEVGVLPDVEHRAKTFILYFVSCSLWMGIWPFAYTDSLEGTIQQ